MGRKKRKAQKAKRKQDNKVQAQQTREQELLAHDPLYKTEDYCQTFLERHEQEMNLQVLKRKTAKAFDKFIYKFKRDFDKTVDEAVAALPKHIPTELGIDRMALAHKMDLVGNQLEERIEVNGAKVILLTQLQLLSRCQCITEGFRVDGEFKKLPREQRNIFWLNVSCEKLGACLLDVRNETYDYPPLAAVILNEGYHSDLDKRIDVHPTDKKRVTVDD